MEKLSFSEVLSQIKVEQVFKRIHEDIGTCNDRLVAIFFDGEHFGYINDNEGILCLEWSVVLCAELVYNSKWVLSDQYNEKMSRYFDFGEEE